MTELVIARVDAGVGELILNRPARINALTRPMIDALGRHLVAWQDDPGVEQVVLRGAGERGFCAGADVREMRDQLLAGDADAALGFLLAEYDLNELIWRYPKPVTAHLLGIAMGGGLGLGMHNTHRIGEPATRLAMPEVAIGLWPDVGVAYELARTPGRTGEYLAMTGETIDGASALWAGLLDQCPGVDTDTSWLATNQQWIDDCFAAGTAAAVVAALEAADEPNANHAAQTIRARSPLSVWMALEAVRRARTMPDVAAVLDQDRVLGRSLIADPDDFIEGVRARMVDRDNQARWRHQRIEDVTNDEVLARFR
ncbi:MAG: enoyl-CoA hydratase/isomerase family protein [Brooklawnia sp.]|jgi:enoyl-CoA hydratase